MHFAIACLAMVGGLEADLARPPVDPLAAYQAERGQAGRSPDDQVKLALWCEAHGLPAERLKHLALAVLADPSHAAARGLMGLVARDGRWQRPEAVADKLKADDARAATLAEYEARRQRAPYTADGQWNIGIWAEEHGLIEQAKAHFTAVVRLDPARDQVWKRLGYRKLDGRWVTEAQLAAEQGDREAQKKANPRWKAVLEKSRAMLDQPSKRDEALAALATITDPRAVPSIARVFATDKPADQAMAVQLLGQIDSPAASKTLAAMAVFARSAETRRLAVETLRSRDARDFLTLWIALIRDPIKYEVRNVGGPGSPGSLYIEGQKANLKRMYSPPAGPDLAKLKDARLSYDQDGLPVLTKMVGEGSYEIVWLPEFVWNPVSSFNGPSPTQVVNFVNQVAQGGHGNGGASHPKPTPPHSVDGVGGAVVYFPYVNTENGLVPITRAEADRLRPAIVEKDIRVPVGRMTLEAQRSADTAKRQLAADVAAIEKANDVTRRTNEPAVFALKAVTGQNFGHDSLAWHQWWTDQQGMVLELVGSTDKPTIVEDVPLDYTPKTTPQLVDGPMLRAHGACFGAGTRVRTIDGSKPIETIKTGDLVLVQDVKSGALSYQGVVTPVHNPPSATLNITLGDQGPIVVTGIHRFWKAGKGWTMARDLKPGDPVRTLGGTLTVTSIRDDKAQPVFNLEVGDARDFFVGEAAALVHDNSLVETAFSPFDAQVTAK